MIVDEERDLSIGVGQKTITITVRKLLEEHLVKVLAHIDRWTIALPASMRQAGGREECERLYPSDEVELKAWLGKRD
jgi:hypothetical protein